MDILMAAINVAMNAVTSEYGDLTVQEAFDHLQAHDTEALENNGFGVWEPFEDHPIEAVAEFVADLVEDMTNKFKPEADTIPVKVEDMPDDCLVLHHHWFDGGDGDKVVISGGYSVGGAPVIYIAVEDMVNDKAQRFKLDIGDATNTIAKKFLNG